MRNIAKNKQKNQILLNYRMTGCTNGALSEIISSQGYHTSQNFRNYWNTEINQMSVVKMNVYSEM